MLASAEQMASQASSGRACVAESPESPHDSRAGVRGTGALAAVLVALLGFLGVQGLVGLLLEGRPELRLPEGSVEAAKFEHFRANRATYDLVFVGTSRVHRGFDPGAFDARMAELGHATHSYNFGLQGLTFLEELHLVDWILEQRSPSLRMLVVEPTERDVLPNRADQLTMREVNWHDFAATQSGLRAAWRSNRRFGQKLEMSSSHLLHCAHRSCNVGVGANLLSRFLSEPAPAPSLPAGFGTWTETAAPGEAPEARAPREMVLEPSPEMWRVLERITQRARAAGVRLMFVIPPTLKSLRMFQEARKGGQLPDLVLYLPGNFPELFRNAEDYFYDEGGHLNAKGAQLFSRRMARDVAQRLEGE